MQNIQIELKSYQTRSAIESLDLYVRMYLGQFEAISWLYQMNARKLLTEEEKENWDIILTLIRNILYPDISAFKLNASRGISNVRNKPDVLEAYKKKPSEKMINDQIKLHEELCKRANHYLTSRTCIQYIEYKMEQWKSEKRHIKLKKFRYLRVDLIILISKLYAIITKTEPIDFRFRLLWWIENYRCQKIINE